MTDDGYEAAHESAAWKRLGAGVLRVTGDDSHDFLDRTVTADIGDEPTRALLLDPDGKTQDSLYVLPRNDGFLVVSHRPEETAETWRSNVFVEDVTVEVTGASVVSVQGPDAASTLEKLDTTATYETKRTPAGGYDGIVENETPDAPLYDDHADALRVEAGVAGFGNELAGRVPVGARLELFSEDKCYVGQEVVARVRQRGGGPSRVLHPLLLDDAVPEGATVKRDGTAVGEVTTVAESPLYGDVGLAYVDADAGETVEIEGVGAEVREPPLTEVDEETGVDA
ncbi:MAG: YgfZ/GcvT domain-containing protein [Halobacteriales archaeon]